MKTKLLSALVLAAGISITAQAQAPYVLLGHSYTQDFSTLATGLPQGWQVYKNATITSLGTVATFNAAPTPWASGTGAFNNYAAKDTFYAGAPAANQNTATNRALGVKQDATLNAGAAFVFRVHDTKGLNGMQFSFDLASLDLNAARTTIWWVDYAIGSSPTSFTSIAVMADRATGNNTFKLRTISGMLPENVNNQDSNVWIRVIAVDPSMGALTWPTSAIDNFMLTWTGKPPLTMASNRTNVPCYGGQTGAYDLVVGGAAPPYQYAVDSIAPNPPVFSNSPLFTALFAGVHTIMVKDADGDISYFADTITQPAPLGSYMKKLNDVTCYAGADGAAYIKTWGGTAPYQYSWDGAQYSAFKGNRDTNIALNGGLHVVTVRDTNNCVIADNKYVPQPDSIVATLTVHDVYCPGGTSGSICASGIEGGNGKFTYEWSTTPVNVTHMVQDLPAGTYSFTVTDYKNCSNTFVATVSQPDPIIAVKNITPDMGNCTGSVTVTPTGGTPGYTYEWSTGSTAQSISDLCYGQVYFLRVTDSRECSMMDTITVPLPTGIAEAGNDNAIKLYPNPAADVLHIEAAQSVNVLISDISGKIMLTVYDAKEMPVSNLATGMYIISIYNDKNELIAHEKFMKQ